MSLKCRECLRSFSLSTETSDQDLIQFNHSNSYRCHLIQEVFCTISCHDKWISSRCAKCFCADDLVKSKEDGLLYCSTSVYEKDQTCLDSHLGFYKNCTLCGYIIRDGKDDQNEDEDEVGIEENKTKNPRMCLSCFERWEEKQLELTKMLFENFQKLRHAKKSCHESHCDCETAWSEWGKNDLIETINHKSST